MHNMTPLPPPVPYKVPAVSPISPSAALRRICYTPLLDREPIGVAVHDGLEQRSRGRAIDFSPQTPVSRWLAEMRFACQAEINSLAGTAMGGAFDMRVNRLSVAFYLLGRLNAVMRAAGGDASAAQLFDAAVLRASGLLDNDYFHKAWGEIASGYDGAARALGACSAFYAFRVLSLDVAAGLHRGYIEARIAEIGSSRRSASGPLDLMA